MLGDTCQVAGFYICDTRNVGNGYFDLFGQGFEFLQIKAAYFDCEALVAAKEAFQQELPLGGAYPDLGSGNSCLGNFSAKSYRDFAVGTLPSLPNSEGVATIACPK